MVDATVEWAHARDFDTLCKLGDAQRALDDYERRCELLSKLRRLRQLQDAVAAPGSAGSTAGQRGPVPAQAGVPAEDGALDSLYGRARTDGGTNMPSPFA